MPSKLALSHRLDYAAALADLAGDDGLADTLRDAQARIFELEASSAALRTGIKVSMNAASMARIRAAVQTMQRQLDGHEAEARAIGVGV